MKWFNNLLIKQKMLFGFGIVILLTSILFIFAATMTNRINNQHNYLMGFPNQRSYILESIRENFTDMQRIAARAALESDSTSIQNLQTQFNNIYTVANNNIDRYITYSTNDTIRERSILQSNNSGAEELKSMLSSYRTAVDSVFTSSSNIQNNRAAVVNGESTLSNASNIIDQLQNQAQSYLDAASNAINVEKTTSTTLFIAILVIVVVLSIVISLFIGNNISSSLKRLLNTTNSLADGMMNINREKPSKDEIGQLLAANYKLADNIILLESELIRTNTEFHTHGEIEAQIDTSLFKGIYKSIGEQANSTVGLMLKDVLGLLDCMQKFGKGNFESNIPILPGKKALMNQTLDILTNTLRALVNDIGSLVEDASRGDLSSRLDVSKYDGDWAKLLADLNHLITLIVTPINEASEVLHKVSLGEFNHQVEGDYKGDFAKIKISINETIKNISSYISEISIVLSNMSNHNNLNQEITREYIGEFSNIKDAINNIIDKFNSVINDILSTAEQVADGSRHLSQSSVALAQGASEEASSIEQLNVTIASINENTMQNATNAKHAEDLATASQKNAQDGNANMDAMLTSMEGINEASNDIAKIIKTIDDIAFQTNLLALNAAVEAARAGEHGKGFAVVAEEVRNLAARSQAAAGETAVLIDGSIQRAKEGTEIANTTAEALHVIVKDAVTVSDIITNIAESSTKQAKAIGKITDGVSQITDVVRDTSATSEESASASQELSSQAEVLKNIVNVFKLKNK